MSPSSPLGQRVARLGRAIARAASEEPSESRQAALEGLSRLADELSDPQLRADLVAITERARAAGDWPESWRAVAGAFARFAAAWQEHEDSEKPT